MKRMNIYIYIYRIAMHLPRNGTIKVGKIIRAMCIRNYLQCCGEGVIVNKETIISKNVRLGNHVGIEENCLISDNVSIGDDTIIGPGCLIYTRNHNFASTDVPIRLQGYSDIKPVTIGSDVWIGARVIILPGVNIGKGSVIGAGSVVTKDVPEWSVVAGNPAKLIRMRKVNA